MIVVKLLLAHTHTHSNGCGQMIKNTILYMNIQYTISPGNMNSIQIGVRICIYTIQTKQIKLVNEWMMIMMMIRNT